MHRYFIVVFGFNKGAKNVLVFVLLTSFLVHYASAVSAATTSKK